jgi:hypothetical protein
VDPYPRSSDWMPITPKTGSLFHADSQNGATRSMLGAEWRGTDPPDPVSVTTIMTTPPSALLARGQAK